MKQEYRQGIEKYGNKYSKSWLKRVASSHLLGVTTGRGGWGRKLLGCLVLLVAFWYFKNYLHVLFGFKYK